MAGRRRHLLVRAAGRCRMTGRNLILAAACLGGLGYLAIRRARRARRWPKPPKSWTRDFYAEHRDKNKGEQ